MSKPRSLSSSAFFIQVRLFFVRLQMKQLFIFKADWLVAVYDLQRLARRSFHKTRPQHQIRFASSIQLLSKSWTSSAPRIVNRVCSK